MKKLTFFIMGLFLTLLLNAQITVEGYVFEDGNRGYIADGEIAIIKKGASEVIGRAITDINGKYVLVVPDQGVYELYIVKQPFFEAIEELDLTAVNNSVVYFKHELSRLPGYIFDITLAEKDPSPDSPRDALYGALVEVYNNTLQQEVIVIDSMTQPDFQIDLLEGNHYTILIRKDGFLSKRMEAFVDVEGCILCFEGIGNVRPGVSDNLTNENTNGTLLANVELDRYFEGKVIGLNNIYYDFGKSEITESASQELNKVAVFLKDNPNLKVELGSHTDSRGKNKSNLKLSQNRAMAAVEYLITTGGIDESRITSQGYGETKLVNKCGDKVDCTEEEHAQNRRTELKVLDFVDISLNRSLRQMKTEEMMDDIINNLGNSDEIRVTDEGDLEDAISNMNKRRLSKTRTLRDYEKQDSPTTINVEKPIEEAVEKVIETTNSEGYTGYRIVIHFSRFEIEKDHEIYKDNDDVIILKTADQNFLYLIGDYKSQRSAEEALDSGYRTKYGNAYVAGFENGIRTY